MNPRVSRVRWILLVAGGVLCVGALLVRRQFPPGRFDGEAGLAALHAERTSLQGCDDRSRDEWRRKAEAVTARAWTTGELTALETRLGPDWRMDQPAIEPGAGFVRVVFSRGAAPLGEWPAFIRLVGELEKLPGLSLTGLELAAAGPVGQRRFTRMVLTLRIAWAVSSGNAERAASLAPLPVSPPSLPAPRGRAGAIPSLRRPAEVGNVPSSAPGAGINLNPQQQIP